MVAHQRIHQGLLEGMAHVQVPVTFGGGSRMVYGSPAGRVAGLLPGLVEVGLEGRRVVAGGELGHAGNR